MAGVKGDFAKLRKLIGSMEQIGAGNAVEHAVSVELAGVTMKLIADGFRKERDPYGDAWAPLKYRKGKILRRTGRMAASANAQPRRGGGVSARISTGYAVYHQEGAELRGRARLRASGARGRFLSAKQAERLKKTKRGRAQLRYKRTSAWEGTLPRRMMVPTKSRGLGPIWAAEYQRVARRALRNFGKSIKGGG